MVQLLTVSETLHWSEQTNRQTKYIGRKTHKNLLTDRGEIHQGLLSDFSLLFEFLIGRVPQSKTKIAKF